jgi:preprotein translocase subunit SecA
VLRELERRVLLSVLDRKWREHLYEMDYLQEGIGLRAMAQRDPLVEYQREGFDMFAAMMDGIQEESVGFLFNLEVEVEEQAPAVTVQAAEPAEAPEDVEDSGELRLDTALLEAAQEAHDQASAPQISAKGLDRKSGQQPMTYTAPELGSDSPSVQTTGDASPAAGNSKSARRQQAKANPNRGSRGSKSKRKR